jgi:uncharacterized protein RhaS with RHS repeats
MQARYYDPVIGRFYSNDPVGYTAKNPVMSFNRYMYVNNNPYKYTDPNGEFLVGAFISLAIEGAVQIAQGELNVTNLAVSFAAGAVGVGIGQKAAQLGKLLSSGNKLAATTSQVAGAVTEAVATNVADTSLKNAINSVTGAKEMQNIDASGAATNAVVNTATGNATGNIVSKATNLSNKKVSNIVTAVVGVAEGARKTITEVLK